MGARELIKRIRERIAVLIREDYAFLVIIGIGLGFLWLSDKMFFGFSDRFSMMIYPIALFLILFIYLIAKVLARVITVLFRRNRPR